MVMSEDEAHVWWVATAEDTGDGSNLLWMLSAAELSRRESLAGRGDRRDYAAAHALLRTTLSMYGGASPDAWEFEPGLYGKPHLLAPPGVEPLDFSLSHASGLVACAVGRSMNVGVDVESLDTVPDCDFLYERYLSPLERQDLYACRGGDAVRARFAELWTLKEALLKAVGIGLQLSPAVLSFAWSDEDSPMLVDRPTELRNLSLLFALYAPTDLHRMALAVESARTPQIVVSARGAHDGDDVSVYHCAR